MPYFTLDDLPPSVRKNLPKKAQEIYRRAFNHVRDSHRTSDSLPKGVSRVAFAAKIAWSAVKEEYVKKKNKWQRKKLACDFSKVQIIDISWPLFPGMPEYDNRKILEFKKFDKETILTLVNHTGTHVDGPKYFFPKEKSIDQFPVQQLLGRCIVLDLTHLTERITERSLHRFIISAGDIVLFKTINSYQTHDKKFKNKFVYLEESGAAYLAKKKIKAVGIDYLALETTDDFPSHQQLLSKNILIIEGLRLEHIKPGTYQLICLPIKVIGLDAAPARAILIKQ